MGALALPSNSVLTFCAINLFELLMALDDIERLTGVLGICLGMVVRGRP